MSSVPLHLLDDQTLVAALIRIQSMPKAAPPTPKATVPEYAPGSYVMRFLSDFSSVDEGSPPKAPNYHKLGKTIAAELWSRGLLRLELPTVERVMRELDAALQEDR